MNFIELLVSTPLKSYVIVLFKFGLASIIIYSPFLVIQLIIALWRTK